MHRVVTERLYTKNLLQRVLVWEMATASPCRNLGMEEL